MRLSKLHNCRKILTTSMEIYDLNTSNIFIINLLRSIRPYFIEFDHLNEIFYYQIAGNNNLACSNLYDS